MICFYQLITLSSAWLVDCGSGKEKHQRLCSAEPYLWLRMINRLPNDKVAHSRTALHVCVCVWGGWGPLLKVYEQCQHCPVPLPVGSHSHHSCLSSGLSAPTQSCHCGTEIARVQSDQSDLKRIVKFRRGSRKPSAFALPVLFVFFFLNHLDQTRYPHVTFGLRPLTCQLYG